MVDEKMGEWEGVGSKLVDKCPRCGFPIKLTASVMVKSPKDADVYLDLSEVIPEKPKLRFWEKFWARLRTW